MKCKHTHTPSKTSPWAPLGPFNKSNRFVVAVVFSLLLLVPLSRFLQINIHLALHNLSHTQHTHMSTQTIFLFVWLVLIINLLFFFILISLVLKCFTHTICVRIGLQRIACVCLSILFAMLFHYILNVLVGVCLECVSVLSGPELPCKLRD